MNIVDNQSVKLLSYGESNINNMNKIIELAGRTCYKSLDKISNDSSKKFVERMIKSNHTAMLEHGTIYLKIPMGINGTKYINNPYSVVNNDFSNLYITTNYRVIIENGWEDDLIYISEYIKDKHEPRFTFCITTNLQVTHELVRHRVFSFAQESSRYCNYSKDKFANELNFVRPRFGKYNDEQLENQTNQLKHVPSDASIVWSQIMKAIEDGYIKLASLGCNAQECAQVLPKATKSDIVVSGTAKDFKHFFDLRLYGKTGKPHPQIQEIAELIYKELDKIGFSYLFLSEIQNSKELLTTYYKLYLDENQHTYTFPTENLLMEYLKDKYSIDANRINIENNTSNSSKTINILDKYGNKIRSIGFVYITKE